MGRRLLRILKWTGLAATVLFAAAFAVNWRTNLVYSARPFQVVMARFHIMVTTRDSADASLQYATFGWSRTWPYNMERGFHHWSTIAPWGTGTSFPLWAPLAAFAIPTIAIFAFDFKRRVRAGHCAGCRFDLQGLAPGAPCPECGSIASACLARQVR